MRFFLFSKQFPPVSELYYLLRTVFVVV